MKRRPEINTRDPPKIQSSSIRVFNGVRSYPETGDDVIRGKRVKFRDPELDCPPNIRHTVSSMQHEAIGDPGSNAPKTSEYAFFKKLKQDAGGCCRSCPLHKKDNQSKKVKPSDFTREGTNFGENSHKVIGTPLLIEKVKPINHNLLLSPLCGALKNSGTEFQDESVFSGKRKKLHQWLAETSLPEVKESCLEGCNLVSVLLNRLFPDSNENNHCWDAKPLQMRADTKYSSHAFPDSNTRDKEFHWTQRRDLVEDEQGWCLDDFRCRSREIITSKWETQGSDSPSTSYAAKKKFQYENKKFGSDYERGTASLITLRDPYFCSNFEKYGSTTSICVKELNKFQDLDDSATGREPCTLLQLGWDSDNLKDEGDSSINTCNTETNSHSTLANSWDHHHQHCLDGSFDASEPYSLSFSNYASKHTLLPQPDSTKLCNWDVGRFLEEEKFLVINKVFSEKHHPDLEALVLPSQLHFDFGWKCLSMSGSFGELHLSTYDDGFQSPQKESPCSYLLTEEEQEDCLYISNHRQSITRFAEDTLDSHEWSSIDFQIPLDDREIYLPLLLDSTSWLRPEEDIHYDDDKRVYI
ncbi:hypothetical protein ACSBR2_032212 [Camellia fascicularis]